MFELNLAHSVLRDFKNGANIQQKIHISKFSPPFSHKNAIYSHFSYPAERLFYKFSCVYHFFLVPLQPKVAKICYEQVRNSIYDECNTVICAKVFHDPASCFPLFAAI